MASCGKCGDVRPSEEFDHPTGGRRHGYCRSCRRAYNREWYRRNRERHIAQVRRNNDRYLARNRAHIQRLKSAPCTDCGQTFPAPVMEFDHVRGEKSAEVSELMRSGSLESIEREIAKCELVCANCHRVRTAVRDWGHDL